MNSLLVAIQYTSQKMSRPAVISFLVLLSLVSACCALGPSQKSIIVTRVIPTAIHDIPGRDDATTTHAGPVVLIDITQKAVADSCYRITIQDILDWEVENGPFPKKAVLLIKTGWSNKYNNKKAYHAITHNARLTPGFDDSVASFLVEKYDLLAVGIDTASLDYGCTSTYGAAITFYRHNLFGFVDLDLSADIPASGAKAVITRPVNMYKKWQHLVILV